jgi:IS30 family transposase
MLRTEFPHRPSLRLAHETIYQALYRQDRSGLSRERTPALRTGRTCRKRRRSREQRTPRFIDPMHMLDERPAEAADRTVAGHWEGDLIMGTHNRSAIGTLVGTHDPLRRPHPPGPRAQHRTLP